MSDAITSTYKKIPDKISNKVNADGKKTVENKEVANRIYVNGSNFRKRKNRKSSNF